MPETDITLSIRAGMLVNGLGGPPVTDGVLAVAGERIAYAGPAAGAPAAPAGARVVHLPDACLLPGLIDMHVHPTYFWEEPDAAPYTYEPEDALVYSEPHLALLAAANLRQALLAGVTTARDMGGVNQVVFDVRRALHKGWIDGPRLYAAGRLIVPSGGHVHYLPGLANQADGPYGLRRAVREEIRAGADFIKLANNGADLTQEELDAAVDEAHRRGVRVACHTSRPPSQRMAIEAGADTFEHGTPTPAEIDLAAERGIAWTPTLNITQAYLARCEERRMGRGQGDAETALARRAAEHWEKEYSETLDYIERKHESIAYALRAGLRLLAGTDSWMAGVRFGAIADEIGWLADYGCAPMHAIQAATLWPAEAMGWEDIGSLAAGKLADALAVAGNPLADIHCLNQVELVVCQGRVVVEGGRLDS